MGKRSREPAAIAAKNRYRNKKYDRVEITLPKGMKEKIEKAAKESGTSKSGYILEAIAERYKREKRRNSLKNT